MQPRHHKQCAIATQPSELCKPPAIQSRSMLEEMGVLFSNVSLYVLPPPNPQANLNLCFVE